MEPVHYGGRECRPGRGSRTGSGGWAGRGCEEAQSAGGDPHLAHSPIPKTGLLLLLDLKFFVCWNLLLQPSGLPLVHAQSRHTPHLCKSVQLRKCGRFGLKTACLLMSFYKLVADEPWNEPG